MSLFQALEQFQAYFLLPSEYMTITFCCLMVSSNSIMLYREQRCDKEENLLMKNYSPHDILL